MGPVYSASRIWNASHALVVKLQVGEFDIPKP